MYMSFGFCPRVCLGQNMAMADVTPRLDEVHSTCNCRARICAPSAIVKDKILKFSKNCGTFAIKES